MKRPIEVYFIAIWAFLQTPFYISTPIGLLGKLFNFSTDFTPILKSCASIGVIVILVGLVLLKWVPRILTIIFLSVACLVIAKIYITLLLLGNQPSLKTYVSFPTFFIINAICIWLLSRKSFIQKSLEYRKQKEYPKRYDPIK